MHKKTLSKNTWSIFSISLCITQFLCTCTFGSHNDLLPLCLSLLYLCLSLSVMLSSFTLSLFISFPYPICHLMLSFTITNLIFCYCAASCNHFFFLTVSPSGSISAKPALANSFVGSFVQFFCSAQGGPDNQFVWSYLRTGEILATTQQLNLTTNVNIGGQYQCEVFNMAGNDAASVTLNGQFRRAWSLIHLIIFVLVCVFLNTNHLKVCS